MSFSSSDHAHPSPSPLKNSPNPPPAPDYLTSIHRPSTAPSFAIDGDSFAPTAQLSGYVLHVDIVGRLTDEGWGDPSGKGKGKQRAPEDGEWAPLARWEVDLRRLIPLADTPPARLPSNTLLVTLAPKGETFYLPHDYAGLPKDAVRSRPSSPTGYSSDTDKPRARSLSKGARRSRDPSRRRGRRHDAAKTASYHDLVKLSTLQACIADTDRSLADIVAEVSRAVDDDGFAIVKREVSEREFRIKTLKEAREEVEDASDDLRSRIDARREELRQRRATLARARELQDADSRASAALEDELATERSLLAGMRACLPPVRSGLIATVGSIFPIEIAAPADLLFTVLGVPLPIPLESKDPAPPLALPKHKDVTEDAVATALGYAAQVVQLLAAYLGRRLVYPITCVGSRSLIKDEISAMVGPRMFPLFSKGVDTYRFEYAVFLLNKDIEMLMSDRDLRALDMRHTLPNLKNLLLTLTDGESARIAPPHNTSMSSLVELETAVRAASPETTSTPVTPRAAPSKLPLDGSSASSITSSEPRTGTSTPPTPESSTFKKSRQYLPDLSPLAGFWRGRPSTASKITVKPVAEGPEERETEEDEEDRRTLREVPLEGDHHGEGKANGHANGHSAAEKVHTPEPSPAAVANVG